MSALDPTIIGQLEATLGGTELVPILQTFEEDLARLAADYEAAADPERARRAAHALAGTAAGIGAKRLEAAARRAMPPDAPDRDALRLAIRQETDAALAEIAALCARLAAA